MRKLSFLIFACSFWLQFRLGVYGAEHEALPNLDQRRDPAAPKQMVDPQRNAAAAELKSKLPALKIDFHEVTLAPHFVLNADGFLTARRNLGPDDVHDPVKQFLNENAALFGHDAAVLADARITRDYVTTHNGLRTVVWEQYLDGIPVFEGVLVGHITRFGELACISSQFLPELQLASRLDAVGRAALANAPRISAAQAVGLAGGNVGENVDAANTFPQNLLPEGPEKRQRFTADPAISQADVSLVWLPTDRDSLRLCWRVTFDSSTRRASYQSVVDAQTGEVVVRNSMTVSVRTAKYNVFTNDSPTPLSPGWSSPNTTQPSRVLQSHVELINISSIASPNGWINDAAPFANTDSTVGNNVDAKLDVTSPLNRPYDATVFPPARPVGTPNGGILEFLGTDFTVDLDLSPTVTKNQNSAVVQLFYWCNWMHDKLYDLGFTEAAGNFQYNNFGRGGLGNDPILADVQDGSGINNAEYVHAADGISPRIQMYIWNLTSPNLDSSLDSEMVLHEYAHGLSSRGVGGGNGGAGLTGYQSIGMGEGWSDFYALALLSESSDNINSCYALGAYLARSFVTANYYFGLRRYP